jgi:putative ABC transport system permease protein
MLRRSSIRYLLRHPWLLGLSIAGVALGVAMVVSIDLAAQSARQSFLLSTEVVAGRATHTITGAAGEVSDTLYRHVRVEAGIRPSAPVIEGFATIDGRVVQVLGIDPLAEGPFRTYTDASGGVDLGMFLGMPGSALVSQGFAREMGLAEGDTIRAGVQGMFRNLRVDTIAEPEDERTIRAMENLVVVDIGTAQGLLNMQGRLSRIDLIVPEGENAGPYLERVRAALPAGVRVERSTARTETLEQMTRAFSLNLTALSLLALIVGMFLIFNTMTFSVVQRRPLLGRLRALGVTRAEVLRMVLFEALLIGLAGTFVGLVAGVWLGQGLVDVVTSTINDLYYVVSVRTYAVDTAVLVRSLLVGVGATLLAALAPALEAARQVPVAVMRRSQAESGARRRAVPMAIAGAILAGVAAGVMAVSGRSLAVSYAGLLGVIVAFALCTPMVLLALTRAYVPPAGLIGGAVGRMAARGITASLSRSSVAIAALATAIAATIGVGIMIGSFRQTVDVWLEQALAADIYVQPPSLVVRRPDATLDPALIRRLAETDGVAHVHSVRSADVASSVGDIELIAIDPGPRHRDIYRFKQGDPDRAWARMLREDAVIISEPFAFRHGLSSGDRFEIMTSLGMTPVDVAGVFYDYGSDIGVAVMARASYDRLYEDPGISGIAIYAAEGEDVDALITKLRERAEGMQEVFIRSNLALRQTSLEVFDRTFAITHVLRMLALVVAFAGILSALMAIQLERAREMAVLRAVGVTPREVGWMMTLQSGLMGLAAGLLALPLGLVMAWVLTYVINLRSFGWTLQFVVSIDLLGQAVVVSTAAALLAGLYPAIIMSRAKPAEALRGE